MVILPPSLCSVRQKCVRYIIFANKPVSQRINYPECCGPVLELRGAENIERTKMPMKVFVATLPTFVEVFEKFNSEAGNNSANLILFLADNDPATNLSWCPDCVRAEPVIYKKLEVSSQNVALLKVYVGDRPTWRNPAHPWRIDSTFKLKGVPTLIRWEDGAIKARLEDHEAHLEQKIDTLLSGK